MRRKRVSQPAAEPGAELSRAHLLLIGFEADERMAEGATEGREILGLKGVAVIDMTEEQADKLIAFLA